MGVLLEILRACVEGRAGQRDAKSVIYGQLLSGATVPALAPETMRFPAAKLHSRG